jgi:polar amino acid transport system permease protein
LVLNSAPVLGNQLIYMLKDTAFLMIITVQELTSTASSVQSEYFVPIEPFLVAVALYWLTSLLIEGVIALIHRLAKERGLGRT